MIVTHKARELTHKINIRQETELPFLIWIAVISTLIASSFGNLVVIGYTIKGLAWYFPFVFSILILLRSSHRVSFPWYLWLPWVCIVMLYLFFSRYPNALQRSIMMLCPVVIGMAISVFPIHEANLKGFRKLCRNMVIAFYIIIILKTGIYATGTLPSVTGLAAEVMTVALLATLFAAYYAYGGRKYLLFWVGLATIPIIAMTRMGMVAAGLTLPLTFAPLNFYKRLTISFAIVVIGASLFYTERFQKRMFYSEQGSINEVRLDNPDFRTTGRMALWQLMDREIEEKPWFGHGANAQEDFIVSIVGYSGQPHNDWKRLFFDYGYVGTLIFGLCMAIQMLHAWKKGRITDGETRILFYAGASSFLPFVLFMLTDNIILYAAFFGNLQFIILGLAYASLKTSMKETAMIQRQVLRTRRDPILWPRSRSSMMFSQIKAYRENPKAE
jgi:hypothetical protein